MAGTVVATHVRAKGWRRTRPAKRGDAYEQLWRVVDGAVADALLMHPEYLTKAGQKWARQSINKRVVGAVLGFAGQPARVAETSKAAANDGLCVTVQAVGHLATDGIFVDSRADVISVGKPWRWFAGPLPRPLFLRGR